MGVPGVVVVKELPAVVKRLASLGLDVETLVRAVEGGLADRNACTDNDPPGFRGFIGWGRTIRRLRELLLPLKWTRTNRRRLAAVVNEQKTIAIAVATGDERTGLDGEPPQSRHPKGPGWEAAVDENRLQLELPLQEVDVSPKTEVSDDFDDDRQDWVTFVLLLYVDPNSGETRCELSLPKDMSAESKLDEWVERILLPSIKPEPEPVIEESSPPAPIDVPVKRRTA